MQDTVAVALIAVGGTVATALIAYGGTRYTTRKQLETVQEATRVQVQSVRHEVKRLEASQKEELRGARQILYEQFLSAVYAVREYMIGNKSVDDDLGGYNDSVVGLRDKYVSMELLASDSVRPKAREMFDLLNEVNESVKGDYSEQDSWDEEFIEAFKPVTLKFRYQIDAFLATMRREIQHRDP
jgi:hypothetical protein